MSVGERAVSVLRPNGTLHVFDCDGPEQVFDTVQCVHCGRHWVWKHGSGKRRGWCTKCNGITCGHPGCDACVPIEQRLSNREAGRPCLAPRSVLVSVPSDIPN